MFLLGLCLELVLALAFHLASVVHVVTEIIASLLAGIDFTAARRG